MIVDWVFEIIEAQIFREINNKETIKIRTDTIGDMPLCGISPNYSKLYDTHLNLAGNDFVMYRLIHINRSQHV